VLGAHARLSIAFPFAHRHVLRIVVQCDATRGRPFLIMWLHQNMTAPTIRLAIGAASAILTAACGTNTPSSTTGPSTPTFHAEVTDPVGDAVASPGVPNPPDIVRGTVDVIGGSITFAIQFAPATLDRQTTRLTIELDTDQNPSTGITGASGLGIDYVLDMWAARTTQTLIQQAMPTTCSSGGVCYTDVGTASLSLGTDSMAATVSLAVLGNTRGRLNYRVFAYASPQFTTPSVTADVMPNINLPPAHVP
jgi:hypothetical protein